MKVILFGGTGMVGQGVLRECLLAPGVDTVVSVGRTALVQKHGKLREVVTGNLNDLRPLAEPLRGAEACFFCLGVSSSGMTEADYRRITYDLTLDAAKVLVELNPAMTFIYVSGAGTDSSERGSSMWARVKGATENALLRLPFKAVFLFRPGIIRPLHGIKSKTKLYRLVYTFGAPVLAVISWLFPGLVTTTEQIGRAMLVAAERGAPKKVLESADIKELAGASGR